MALGAGRGQLIRQFLTESLLLSMAGGLLGLALGYVMMVVMEAVLRNQPLNPSFVPYWIPAEATIGINGPVLLFTFVVSVLSGVGFGLVPAIRTTRPSRDASMGLYRRASVRRAHRGLHHELIVTELALAFVLLTGADLLVRSLIAMKDADTGFSATNALTAELPIWEHRFPNDDALRAYLRQLTAAIEHLTDHRARTPKDQHIGPLRDLRHFLHHLIAGHLPKPVLLPHTHSDLERFRPGHMGRSGQGYLGRPNPSAHTALAGRKS
jgi:hypothetical protein